MGMSVFSGTPDAFENLENLVLRKDDAHLGWKITDSAQKFYMKNFQFNIIQ
jgi:hypothetical protein